MIKLIAELQALAQSGLAYDPEIFDRERYERILAISAEMLASQSNHRYEDVLEIFNADKGYATPKVDVRGALFENDKILLVREKSDGLWSLPGGWADIGLSPVENVLKEIQEEAGIEAHVQRLIGIYDKNKSNPTCKWPAIYKIFFLCERAGISAGPLCSEILEAAFFSRQEMPPLSLNRVTPLQIEECFHHHDHPEAAPFFE